MNEKLQDALAIVEKYGMKGDVIYKEIEALAASKPAPQAQAGEPEVHVTMDDAIAAGDGTLHGAIEYWQNQCAKKDAALDACVVALEEVNEWRRTGIGRPPEQTSMDAITQAKEARK